jgi:hypothetical protein
MELLEYIVYRQLGEPIKVVGRGESYWACPGCGSEKFHTLPYKPEYPHRTRCWCCQLFDGDAADFVGRFDSTLRYYGQKCDRVGKLREEYERVGVDLPWGGRSCLGSASAAGSGTRSSSGDAGGLGRVVSKRALADVWSELTEEETSLLLSARALMDRKANGLDFHALTDFLAHWDEFFARTDQAHAECCNDPDCDARVCRAGRGLPPLTREDIEAERRAEEARRQEEADRAQRMLREMHIGNARRQLERRRVRNRMQAQTSRNGTGGNHAGRQ